MRLEILSLKSGAIRNVARGGAVAQEEADEEREGNERPEPMANA